MIFGFVFLKKNGRHYEISNANTAKTVVIANKLLFSAAKKLSKEENIELDTAYNLIVDSVIENKNLLLSSKSI